MVNKTFNLEYKDEDLGSGLGDGHFFFLGLIILILEKNEIYYFTVLKLIKIVKIGQIFIFLVYWWLKGWKSSICPCTAIKLKVNERFK